LLISPKIRIVRIYHNGGDLQTRVQTYLAFAGRPMRSFVTHPPIGSCVFGWLTHRRPSPSQRKMIALFNNFMLWSDVNAGLDVPYAVDRLHRSLGGSARSQHNG